MRSSLKVVGATVMMLVLSACAEGTTVVTGQQRPAVNPSQVQIYANAPELPYEVIAIVSASSGNGWTDQQSLDYAVDELKNQAAAVGANGVILGQAGEQNAGFVFSGGIAIPVSEQTLSGNAIFVPSR